MYCPECRAEYREGFVHCADCDVDLVDALPPEDEPDYLESATVFEGDPNNAELVCATLEGSGIEAWVENEAAQSVYPGIVPAKVEVNVNDEERALEALEPGTEDLEAMDDATLGLSESAEEEEAAEEEPAS